MMIEHKHAGPGETCEKCGELKSKHRAPRVREDTRRGRARPNRPRRSSGNRGGSKKKKQVIIGIDGEGHDLPDGRHIYTLLCAVDERGEVVGEVENQKGLSTTECLEMLLALPTNALRFVFMGSYDFTKIIEELPTEDIYFIMHPDSRVTRHCKACKFKWKRDLKQCPRCGSKQRRAVRSHQVVTKDRHGTTLGPYTFDWFNGSFTIGRPGKGKKKRCRVWDVFKFFQSSFVKAIEAWDVASRDQIKRIGEMKAQRGSFATVNPDQIREYCREECFLLALMMRKLITACADAGISLQRYDGAGSIASSLLKQNAIQDFMGPPLEDLTPGLEEAVMSAYFGGRFENSIVGHITQPVNAYDISSAYPYALSQLPCLACGAWELVTKDVMRQVKGATLAVVNFEVRSLPLEERSQIAWMPLPCRTESGSICFPSGFSGWAWKPEILAALRGWREYIKVKQAWIYRTECDHRPWTWMPLAYRQRTEWGSDGKGMVMKLGVNACAGKTMQNVGDPPPFKSWVWGGMTTATTRAQALDAICACTDRWNMLAIATDGVFTTENLKLPKPVDTGTSDLKKPLGGWDAKEHPTVFFVKPGMYFDDTKHLMRARGIGRQELTDYKDRLVEAFASWDRQSPIVIKVVSRRFYGARTSVQMRSSCSACKATWQGTPWKTCPKCKQIGDGYLVSSAKMGRAPERGSDERPLAFGRWDERDIEISFAAYPKREHIEPGGSFGRMRVRDMGGVTSMPYLGVTSPEGLEARLALEEALEEPDWHDDDD
jgi:hypothetical protein